MRKCIGCGNEFDKPKKGNWCYPCRYKKYDYVNKYGNEYQKVKREERSNYYMTLMSEDDSMLWIAKQYDKKLFIDMKGLSELILVYDSLGGSQQLLDEYSPGEQLQRMWKYVNNKFIKRYEKLL